MNATAAASPGGLFALGETAAFTAPRKQVAAAWVDMELAAHRYRELRYEAAFSTNESERAQIEEHMTAQAQKIFDAAYAATQACEFIGATFCGPDAANLTRH